MHFLVNYSENDDAGESDDEIITSNESISKISHTPNKLVNNIFGNIWSILKVEIQ